MAKTAEKSYPLGRTYLYSPYKGVPPRETSQNLSSKLVQFYGCRLKTSSTFCRDRPDFRTASSNLNSIHTLVTRSQFVTENVCPAFDTKNTG